MVAVPSMQWYRDGVQWGIPDRRKIAEQQQIHTRSGCAKCRTSASPGNWVEHRGMDMTQCHIHMFMLVQWRHVQ